MTAEAIIMNKNAVAIAADSAVTIQNRAGIKIFNTVNKLFNLSYHAPVALVIYGNAEFSGLPWEALVKDYRRALGSRSFNTVDEYCKDFFIYLNNIQLDSEEDIETCAPIIYGHLSLLLDDIRDKVIVPAMHENIGKRHISTADALTSKIENYLLSKEQRLAAVDFVNGYEAIKPIEILRTYRRIIYFGIRDILESGLPPLTIKARRAVWSIAYHYLTKKLFSPNAANFVIVGFGQQEMMPSLRGYTIDGKIYNILKYEKTHENDITRKSPVAVVPLAQQDMVYRFMEGVDKGYQNYAEQLVRQVVGGLPDIFCRLYIKGKKKQEGARINLERIIDGLLGEITEHVAWYRRKNYVDPIIEAVTMLPKEELAVLAEALVQLTSLKRKMSMDPETVGEPIDVAVISKGDGFVWIKRKHYFPAELNPRFMGRYMVVEGRIK